MLELRELFRKSLDLKIFQETGHEPAGSEGAKFRLWVKSKGLSLSPGERREGEGGEEEVETMLYLPTGTEQVPPWPPAKLFLGLSHSYPLHFVFLV